MPLPMGAENFLDVAINCLKADGGIIHFYNWGDEPKLFEKAEKLVAEAVKKFGRKYKILNRRVVLPYAPHKFKICLDVQVE
jgi:tRNA (guanine37-N1)-methyltransferase